VQSPAGPARKYYRMTDEGLETLKTWREEWRQFRSAVDGVLGGEGQ
jgi:PadR family transcriptional regulator, regulatory protein PadR